MGRLDENDSVYAGATNDLIDFTSHMANAYFRSVKEALKQKRLTNCIWVAGLIMETFRECRATMDCRYRSQIL